MLDMQLKKILLDIKSKKPKKRYMALNKLYELKNNKESEVDINTLKDIIKIAAYSFPEPYDDWDRPSYYLLDYVSDFKHYALVDPMIDYYDKFNMAEKEIVLNFLCEFDDDKCFNAIMEIYERELKTDSAIIPIDGLFNHPLWIKRMISKFYNLLIKERYRESFYRMLLFCFRMEVMVDFKSELVLSILVDDYKKEREKFKDYNSSYSAKDVYMAWKVNYLKIREKLVRYLSLMEYYFDETTENLIIEALHYNDPLIKMRAIRVAFQRNLSVEKHILLDCAKSIESSEALYWELLDIRKEHLYPIKEKKQHLFAKSHFFHYLINETDFDDFPREIKVMDSIETMYNYDQPVRYYLLSFSNSFNETFIGWVGGYNLEQGDDNIYMWDGTYTTFESLEAHSIEKHKRHFMNKQQELKQAYSNEIHYKSKPSFPTGYYVLYVYFTIQWIRFIFTDVKFDSFLLVLTLIASILTITKWMERKKYTVKLVGDKLIYNVGKEKHELLLHTIKRITVERKSIHIYNKENELVFQIKKNHVKPKYFLYYIRQLTNELKEPPFIEEY